MLTLKSRRTDARLAVVAGFSSLMLVLAACSSSGNSGTSASPSPSSSSSFTAVSIVTPATEADHGWNQMGLKGAKEATTALGLQLDTLTNVGYDNTQTILTQAAKKPGVGLVIAHASGFTQAADKANAATNVPILTVDFPNQQLPGKVGVLTFSAQQGGYLAGIAAAMNTKSNKIGIAISADDLNWFTMSGGFVAGARSVNPKIQIDVAYVGAAAYDDSAGGKKVVQQLIAKGDDVIFGMGDGATIGYIAAIEAATTPVKYIADIGDVSDLIKNPSQYLTSVLWVFTGADTQAIKDVQAGTFANKPYNLDLANGGIALQTTPAMNSATTTATNTAKAGIIAGTISVPSTTSKSQLNALLAK